MRISISLELAEYLLERHMDCLTDGLGFKVPEAIVPKIESLRQSIRNANDRQRVKAKRSALLARPDAEKESQV